MFGYVLANIKAMTKEEQRTYKAHYCGLCHVLKDKYGHKGMFRLSYDMVFLEMLLSDLEDSEETEGWERCIVSPAKKHCFVLSDYTEYASDMLTLLSYYSSLDDYNDEGKGERVLRALEPFALEIEKIYPEINKRIKEELFKLSYAEKNNIKDPENISFYFGNILGEIFSVNKNSFFKEDLKSLGISLGRFIYILDAWNDRKKDSRKKIYNPLREEDDEKSVEQTLLALASSAYSAFDRLPLDKHTSILKNILCSGIWLRFKKGESDG